MAQKERMPMGSVTKRARGVWLAHVFDDREGTEAWDAFATLPEAKRWVRENADGDVLRWEHDPDLMRWQLSAVIELMTEQEQANLEVDIEGRA